MATVTEKTILFQEELFDITEIGLKQGNFKTNDNSTKISFRL